jgi:hypothetical protein
MADCNSVTSQGRKFDTPTLRTLPDATSASSTGARFLGVHHRIGPVDQQQVDAPRTSIARKLASTACVTWDAPVS